MSEPGEPGVPSPTAQAEDAWWDAVYGPPEREPASRPSAGTVDDWFATALGAIGVPHTTPAPRTPVDDSLPPVPSAPPSPRVPDPRVGAPRPVAADVDLDLDPDVLAWPSRVTPAPEDAHDAIQPSGRQPEHGDPAVADAAAPSPSDQQVHDAPLPSDRQVHDAPPPRAAPVPPRNAEPPVPPEPPTPPGPPAPPRDVGPADAAPLPPKPTDPPAAPAAGPPAPPHVPTPTLPDGAALRWGRSRPAAGAALPEPDALPEADPEDLRAIVPDTVLELARHGSMTLRAGSARSEDARALGAPRSDRLVVVRFGEGADGLMVVVVTSGRGAGEAARLLAAAVGRSRAGLLVDLRQGAQERLRFGLQRLTARAARVLGPEGALHAVLAPLDATNRLRAGFGTGPGALMLLGDDAWYDAYAGRRLGPPPEGGDGSAAEPGVFRFRAVVPEPGDVLLVCTEGLATPLRAEPAVAALLAEHWSQPHAPSGVDFLRQIQARASGHSGDRTAAALWED